MPADVLAISDNPELARFLLEEFEAQGLARERRLDLRYTSINKSPDAMIALGADAVDLTHEAQVEAILAGYRLVFSMHCKKIFPKRLVEGVTCVNFHPGYNPHNRGWYPQVFAILNGKPIGTTIHLMTVDIDGGPIIAQEQVETTKRDNSLTLYRRVIDKEKALIRRWLRPIVEGRYETHPPASEGNYNSIADFRALCALDLERVGTLGEHIDLLRALSHPPFANGWFLDEQGEKVFVALDLR